MIGCVVGLPPDDVYLLLAAARRGRTILFVLWSSGPRRGHRGTTGRHGSLRRHRGLHRAERIPRPRGGEAARRWRLSIAPGRHQCVRWAGRQGPRRRRSRDLRSAGGPRGRPGPRHPRCAPDARLDRVVLEHATRSRHGAPAPRRHQHRRGPGRLDCRHRRLHGDGRRREPGIEAAVLGPSRLDLCRRLHGSARQ